MATAKRRVTYILPSSTDNIPRLQLPPHGMSRLGATAPLLMQYRDKTKNGDRRDRDEHEPHSHPRHRLGVASLALDTSTMLTGRRAPEGILYSGGRDGLIMSWDLSIPMKRRRAPERNKRQIRGGWEVMTGWDDDIDEEADDADDRLVSDGDVLGDVTSSINKRKRTVDDHNVPYERQWETDGAAFQPGIKTQFRQSAQAHSDWVNDILLCNFNQTVVSASSDGTIKSWSPHASTPTDPTVIGSHSDYVRCLAHCREQNWVASGSFDRTIKIWDIQRAATDPLVTLYPPDALAPKSSVYAVAADPFGHMVASGSPERVVRLWDPRTGKRTGKLVGHTDNIRAILVSDDSKYLLTGSADASVKLWSLSSQRCLHTFTHHTDSVWSLYSDHPSLEVFYSGDRSGLVCRVDVEDCSDVSEGECLLLCNEATVDASRPAVDGMGINKVVVMDDNLLWTASGTSTIRRWHIPQRRSRRTGGQPNVASPTMSPEGLEGENVGRLSPSGSPSLSRRRALPDLPTPDLNTRSPNRRLSTAPSVQSSASDIGRDRDTYGSWSGYTYGSGQGNYAEGDPEATRPYDSMVRLISPHDSFTLFGGGSVARTGRDPEVATLYSAASVVSVPHHLARTLPSPTVAYGMNSGGASAGLSPRTDDAVAPTPLSTARAMYETRELAADALPAARAPDDVITGAAGLVRAILLNDRTYALTVDTEGSVAVWDIIRGICLGSYSAEDVAGASHAGSTAGGREEREHSPREALEAVRERIEGEAVVINWCHADTKAGVLSIHLTERCFEAEVYADEVGFVNDRNFNDESKLNMGKWVLRNLFIGFIKEEMRLHHDSSRSKSPSRKASHDTIDHTPHTTPPTSSHSPDVARHPLRRAGSTTVQCAPNMTAAVPPLVTGPIRSSPLLAPLIPLHPLTTEPMPILPASATVAMSATPFDPTTPTPIAGFHQRARSGTLDSTIMSSLVTPTSGKAGEGDYFTSRVRQPSIAVPGSPDDFSGWGGPGSAPGKQLGVPEPPTPSTPSGLIGRLKIFGKSGKRPVSDAVGTAGSGAQATPTAEPTIPEGSPLVEITQTAVQRLLAGPLEPPSSLEAPLIRLPPSTTVLIAEEAQPSYTTLYRGTVSQTHLDVEALEEAMPLWLLEYLLKNQVPASVPLSKISFVLVPWNRDPNQEPLPELLNTQQSKLTASRYLRVRKIVAHVHEKLEKLTQVSNSRAASVRSLSDPQETLQRSHRLRAEDEYEILCNETLLPLGMSLAAIRQYVWKQGTELVLYYRRKSPTPTATASDK